MIWAVFDLHSNLLKIMISVAYHLSKQDHIEMISFFFVNLQNNMISDMHILFSTFMKNGK